jgi:hypothetical protein
VKTFLLGAAIVVVANGAFAYEPAVEQKFSDLAAEGCNNRDGEFLVRGMVSNANENTVVLSDPLDSSSTISLTLPGRGPFARVKGVFGQSKYEASADRLNELRATHTAVVVTLKCKGNGKPIARNISYTGRDGTRGSISF